MNPLSDADIIEAVRSSLSIAGVIRTLGRALVGTNYRFVKREVARLGLDTSHWKGGSPYPHPHAIPSSDQVFVEDSNRPRNLAKKIILREKLLPFVCAECGLGPVWRGKPLVLRLDHKNGVRNDDRLENLRFLCPNCDSQMDTFCGRNKPGSSPHKKRPCTICGKTLTWASRCRSCSQQDRHKLEPQATKIVWPSIEELQARLIASSFLAVAKELGVSDNAIRKHLRSHARVAEGGGF